jgi:antitoxin ParD1/3/4
MARSSRPLTVTLGELQRRVDQRVKSGAYSSASEVLRAAVRALDREENALDDWLKARVDEAFDDGTKNLRAAGVFKQLRSHHARQMKRSK